MDHLQCQTDKGGQPRPKVSRTIFCSSPSVVPTKTEPNRKVQDLRLKITSGMLVLTSFATWQIVIMVQTTINKAYYSLNLGLVNTYYLQLKCLCLCFRFSRDLSPGHYPSLTQPVPATLIPVITLLPPVPQCCNDPPHSNQNSSHFLACISELEALSSRRLLTPTSFSGSICFHCLILTCFFISCLLMRLHCS